jgi:antirestriction protein ArdC
MERRYREHHPDADPVRESLDRLEQAVAAIQDSDSFRFYLDAQARFHHYSWGNVLLILAQHPNPTRIAGYRTWQSLERHVRRGEKAIRIIAPSYSKRKYLTNEGEEEEEQHLYFRSVSVFDVSQTEGKPLPEVEVPVLEGEEGAELYTRLEGVAAIEGLTVKRSHERFERSESMMGFFDPELRGIFLREAGMRQMTKTLAHELAHHFGKHELSSPATESEAESVAYVVLRRFGVDSGERSFPYVATWAQNREVFKAALSHIQAISVAIIERIETTGSDPDEPTPAQLLPAARFLNGCQ